MIWKMIITGYANISVSFSICDFQLNFMIPVQESAILCTYYIKSSSLATTVKRKYANMLLIMQIFVG